MYSPKIHEDLIPSLYRIAKARKLPMTKLVNSFLWNSIQDIEIKVKELPVQISATKEEFIEVKL